MELVERGEAAIEGARLPPELAGFLRCIGVLVRAYCAQRMGDLRGACRLADVGISQLPPDESVLRAALLVTGGLARAKLGDEDEAFSFLEQAQQHGLRCGNFLGVLTAIGWQARLHRRRGQLDEAERLCRTALRIAEDARCAMLPIVGFVRAELAQVHLDRGALDRARAEVDEAVERLRLMQYTDEFVPACLARARIQHAQGEIGGAAKSLDEVEEIVARFGQRYYDSEIADLRARLGSFAANATAGDRPLA
jgi:ATP/maltotriose-dependent transcriptional regulator MalT